MKTLMAIAFVLTGCASGTIEECPSLEQEPVSLCRAIEKCTSERSPFRHEYSGLYDGDGDFIKERCIRRDLKRQERKHKE